MRLGLILSVLAIGFFAGCNTSVTTVDYTTSTKTGAACDLDVYTDGLMISRPVLAIGAISVRDSGFTLNCSQEVVMSQIRNAACEAGADAIQMVNVVPPSFFGSSCFQASARFLQYQ